MASERDALAALVKDAYYHARDHGGTMHTAADDAADAILAAGWVSPEDYREAFLRMSRAAATVERVRALCDEARFYVDSHDEGGLDLPPTARLVPVADLRAALAAPPGPAAPGGHGEGRA